MSFACICLHVVISQLCVKIQENKMTFLALSSRQMFKEAKKGRAQKKCIFSNQRVTHADAEVCAFPQTDFINKLV